MKQMDALHAAGTAALSAREDVAAIQGKVSLRIAQWKDDANHVRRGVETALDKYATDQRYPRGYADEFFPVTRYARKTDDEPSEPK
ncbi:MAG: hypothetical protein IPK82_26690 [Polyangiaceae bacterium]|nr:hypothetical protein [Polyangiaceae bacterium]